MKKIESEDLQKFQEFERKILEIELPRIKYIPDLEIQAEVRKQVLIENYGEEKLTEALSVTGMEPRDLGLDYLFFQVSQILQNNPT
ncbi:hypothetical protein EBS02_01295 [bacterium]|jgi:hypothetical protein|nr:hypothetical protein [bacterium]